MYSETAPRADEAEKLELSAELIAEEVLELALPLSQFADNNPYRAMFYERMGIRKAECSVFTNGDHRVYIADDTVQESGSFKSRGAAYAAMTSSSSVLTAASAGNHGNGVAIAGRRLGKEVVIEAAATASEVKVTNMKRNEATVHAVHTSVDAAMPAAKNLAREKSGTFIHPYDDLRVIAGQATLGFDTLAELLADESSGHFDLMHDPAKVFVPIGGGGLISGVASVFRWAKDVGVIGEQVQVIGVQMEGCDAMRRSVEELQAYRSGPLFAEDEFNPACDGTAVQDVGSLTLQIAADKRYVADIVTVSEAELGHAMQELVVAQGKRIEPAGALSMAGALVDMHQNETPSIYMTVSSGRNVSQETWDHFATASGYKKAEEHTQRRALGGYVVREMAAHPRPESVRPSRESIDDYYDVLEEQGIFMVRRYN
jgi:threonine dehydratase